MKLTFSHKRHYYRFLQITEDQSESTIIKKEVWESINHIAISVMAKTETLQYRQRLFNTLHV